MREAYRSRRGPGTASKEEFVGRGRAGLLTERISAAGRGKGGVVLVGGEPGIGKTRLAAEAAAVASRLGMAPLLQP